jgi:RNA polymerase sigma-70 factor, ECF subfamily
LCFLGYAATADNDCLLAGKQIAHSNGVAMSNDPTPNWNAIVQRHAERVFRIAYRILGSVHDAEDVSQIVFTEAFRAQTNGPVQSWSGLFARMATMRAIDLLRRRRKTLSIADDVHASHAGPHENAVGAELATWLRDATSKLPEQQAAIFSLTHFEQLDRNEVAAVLCVSPESVSTALYKARQRLLEQLNFINGTQTQ